jgi:AcrR family transcriptional regulator
MEDDMKQALKPMRADACRNRERVLEAADKIFTSNGLKAQMEDVADMAGVGIGTVYRNFPTKEILIEAVVTRIFESLLEKAQGALEEPDAGTAFREFVTGMAEVQARHRGFREEMAARIGMPVTAAKLKRSLHQTVTKLVARAQEAGAIRKDVGPADIAMLVSGLAHAVDVAGDFEPTLHQRYINIIFDGLRPLEASPLPGRPLSYSDLQRLKKKANA